MSAQRNNPNTLKNLVDELRSLANDLAQGNLRVGSKLVAVGPPLLIKTKQKISGDSAYCTLSFQVPLLDSDREVAHFIDRMPPPARIHETRHDKELRLKGRPPEGKKIKKEISGLWKTVSQKLEQGQSPTPVEEKALVSAFENYTVFTEPAWHEEWLACLNVLREALSSARKGDMRTALEQAAKVNALTKACHKQHK